MCVQFIIFLCLGQADEPLEISRDSLFEEIKEDIISLFVPHIQNLLRMCGFKFGRVEKSKRIILLGDVEDGTHLENQLLQSKIIMLPLNDFPNNLPVIEESDPSFSETSANSSMQSLNNISQGNSTYISDNSRSEQALSSGSSSVPQSPATNRLPRRSRRLQLEVPDKNEEEFSESEDDQLGMCNLDLVI